MNKYNKYLLVESPVAASGFLSVVLRFLFSLTWHSGREGRTRKGNKEKTRCEEEERRDRTAGKRDEKLAGRARGRE